MSLSSIVNWIYVVSASSSVLSKLIWFSSHVWEITFVEFCWDACSSVALLSSIFPSLILVLDSVSVSFWKGTSSFDECLVWTLILGMFLGMFEFSITLSLLYVFRSFYSLLFTYEVTVVHLLLLELNETFRACFLLGDVNTMTIYFTFVK